MNKFFAIVLISTLFLSVLVLGCTGQQQTVEKPQVNATTSTQQNQTPPVVKTPVTAEKTFLVADTENHRILKIDSSGKILWKYGCPNINTLGICTSGYGDNLLLKPTAATFAGDTVLIAEREHHRIIEVDSSGDIVWSYGQYTSSGFGPNELWYPNYAERLSNGNTLIADGYNHRVIEVTPTKEIVWTYGCSLLTSGGKCSYSELRNPRMATRLADGNTLIADSEDSRIIEVNKEGNIVWEYKTGLSIPYFAYKTSDGNIVIANTKSNKVIEVSPDGNLIWEMTGLNFPTSVIKTGSGTYLIADSYGNRVIEVNSEKNITWQYGTGKFSNAEGELAHPSTIFVS
jgi:uncharacterized protein (UPF0248 family)